MLFAWELFYMRECIGWLYSMEVVLCLRLI